MHHRRDAPSLRRDVVKCIATNPLSLPAQLYAQLGCQPEEAFQLSLPQFARLAVDAKLCSPRAPMAAILRIVFPHLDHPSTLPRAPLLAAQQLRKHLRRTAAAAGTEEADPSLAPPASRNSVLASRDLLLSVRFCQTGAFPPPPRVFGAARPFGGSCGAARRGCVPRRPGACRRQERDSTRVGKFLHTYGT